MTKLLAAARGLAIALGLSALCATPAMAQQVISVNVDSIAAVLKGEGFKANIVYDDLDPAVVKIFSSDVKADVVISMEDCDEYGCSIMALTAVFFFTDDSTPVASLEKINDWNENNFGKAFLGAGRTMWITTETSVVGGLTKANLVDTLDLFMGLMRDYTAYIGWQAS